MVAHGFFIRQETRKHTCGN